MALLKLKDYYPNYRQQVFGGEDIQGMDVYAGRTEEKIGLVCDDVIDLTGRFRYLVIDTSFWGIDKKVLLPVGACQLDYAAQRIYALPLLNKKQVEELPDYADGIIVDYNYDEQASKGDLSKGDRLASRSPLFPCKAVSQPPINTTYESPTYTQEPAPLPQDINEQNYETIELYEERLIAKKYRKQVGEIVIEKRVETQTARLSVPLEKEQIIIERKILPNGGIEVSSEKVTFQKGEVARIAIYEERAAIHKRVFLREEITLKKEIELDTMEAEEQIRREELEIKSEGHSSGEKPGYLL